MIKSLILVILILTILVVLILYLIGKNQEKLIFFPEVLPPDFQFEFQESFEERYFQVKKSVRLHAIHFKVEQPVGLVLYFHGNAGSNRTWGYVASDFVNQNYDVLILDYRGYGKSQGKISNERMLHRDAEFVYAEMTREYAAEDIVFYGRSLGTGIASRLAVSNPPRQLILETPYFNFQDIGSHHYSFLPISLILKYNFHNNRNLEQVKVPVYLIHGTADDLIPFNSSVRLEKIGDHIQLTKIEGGTHNNLPEYEEYQQLLKDVLGAGN